MLLASDCMERAINTQHMTTKIRILRMVLLNILRFRLPLISRPARGLVRSFVTFRSLLIPMIFVYKQNKSRSFHQTERDCCAELADDWLSFSIPQIPCKGKCFLPGNRGCFTQPVQMLKTESFERFGWLKMNFYRRNGKFTAIPAIERAVIFSNWTAQKTPYGGAGYEFAWWAVNGRFRCKIWLSSAL